MLTNVEKLTQLGMIGAVRQRLQPLGADDEDTTLSDSIINKMSNSALVEAWAAWELGNGYWWWSIIKSRYDELEKLSK